MKVFKFGGASVKDADAIKNIRMILKKHGNGELLIILSAMGKTTNALEALTASAYTIDGKAHEHFTGIRNYHLDICKQLFPDQDHRVYAFMEKIFVDLESWITVLERVEREYPYDLYYDQIIPAGELLSTLILSAYLEDQGLKNKWLDARRLIITDDTYRAARVDWSLSSQRIAKAVEADICITQGFIGSNGTYSTSLGREGSDFTAAIFANVLDAEEVVVWKDVPGYLNADPKYFKDTVKLDKLSYAECIELAFYGAKIIHPKTIRPLENKRIPLIVKSFLDPASEGSHIHSDQSADSLVPSCIIKEDQILISIASRDFSFIAEDHLHNIFGIFSRHRCEINLMQNSAISFSVCVDASSRLPEMIRELQKEFKVRYNAGLQLITIRHYDKPSIEKLTEGKDILLEQRSRVTYQVVVKPAQEK